MSDRMNNKYKESLFNLKDMKVNEFYNLCMEYHKEGKTGRIRFPKWLRDLHRKITINYHSSETIITSQLIDVLNCKSLKFCDKKILEINSQSVQEASEEEE